MVVVVLEEGEKLETAEAASGVAVNSLECRVWREVSNLAEALAEAFKLTFTVADCDKQVLKSVF